MTTKTTNWTREELEEIQRQKEEENAKGYVHCTRCKTPILFDNRTGYATCKCKEGCVFPMAIPKSIENAAVRATQLKRQIADLLVGLDKEKDAIRTWAMTEKEKDAGLSMLEIPTNEGTCTVTFPIDKPEVVKGMDPMILLHQIAPAKLELIGTVESKWVFAKGFGELWNRVARDGVDSSLFSPDDHKAIELVVTLKPQTPRVEPAK